MANYLLDLLFSYMRPDQRIAYPSQSDVSQAQASGLGYGTGMEQYFSGEMPVRAINTELSHLEARGNPSYTGDIVSSAQPTNKLNNFLTQAYLMSNRSPIAALGFDPSHTIVNTEKGDYKSTYGMYNRGLDTIISDKDKVDTLPHESMHRGFYKLKEKYGDKLTDDQKYVIEKVQEFAVREEIDRLFKPSSPSRFLDEAKAFFNSPGGSRYKKALEELNQLAAQEIARRQPMGPR